MGESKSSTQVASGNTAASPMKSVADTLESELDVMIQEWLARVGKEPELTAIPLNFQERTGHLPQLLHDVIVRLRLDDETKAPISQAAAHHGDLRAQQGYTAAMAVEESRLLEVSIFWALHRSKNHLEFSAILPAVLTIADEVDAQVKQQMLHIMAAEAAKAAKRAKRTFPRFSQMTSPEHKSTEARNMKAGHERVLLVAS
jgi:hypothetical protein